MDIAISSSSINLPVPVSLPIIDRFVLRWTDGNSTPSLCNSCCIFSIWGIAIFFSPASIRAFSETSSAWDKYISRVAKPISLLWQMYHKEATSPTSSLSPGRTFVMRSAIFFKLSDKVMRNTPLCSVSVSSRLVSGPFQVEHPGTLFRMLLNRENIPGTQGSPWRFSRRPVSARRWG